MDFQLTPSVSLPFDHPDFPENQGSEKSFARGKYVSVERVKEVQSGNFVEWRMATASDAGGAYHHSRRSTN